MEKTDSDLTKHIISFHTVRKILKKHDSITVVPEDEFVRVVCTVSMLNNIIYVTRTDNDKSIPYDKKSWDTSKYGYAWVKDLYQACLNLEPTWVCVDKL